MLSLLSERGEGTLAVSLRRQRGSRFGAIHGDDRGPRAPRPSCWLKGLRGPNRNYREGPRGRCACVDEQRNVLRTSQTNVSKADFRD